jgi:tagatose 6-phosphate kinase
VSVYFERTYDGLTGGSELILCVNLNPCVDKTLYLERIRPNAIQAASSMTVTVGGKANNVARVLKAYGRNAVAMNFFGRETGELCERLLREDDHLAVETVWTKAPTREIITIYETALQQHTDIKEPSPEITPAEREEFVHRYSALLRSAEMVSFGGSAPSKSVDTLPAELARLARQHKVPFVLDTSGKALELGLDERPWLVKPNRAEAEALFGKEIKGISDAVRAVKLLAARSDIAILSLGETGFVAAYKGRYYAVAAPKVDTVNAVGSGDALVAGVIMGVLDRWPFADTLALAAAAASANAASPLACKIRPGDVEPLKAYARVEVLPTPHD